MAKITEARFSSNFLDMEVEVDVSPAPAGNELLAPGQAQTQPPLPPEQNSTNPFSAVDPEEEGNQEQDKVSLLSKVSL